MLTLKLFVYTLVVFLSSDPYLMIQDGILDVKSEE